MTAAVGLEYRLKPGARLTERDAEVIAPALAGLAHRHCEGFRAEDVVEAARPETAPLHPYFEWDDAVAAELFRVEQARGLVRSIEVRVEVRPGPEPIAAWVRQYHHVIVPQGPDVPPQPRYMPVQVIQQRGDLTRQIIESAARELRGWKERYGTYRYLQHVQEPLNALIEAIEAMDPDEAAEGGSAI